MRAVHILGVAVLASWLAGCSTPVVAPPEHVVLVDHSGHSLHVDNLSTNKDFLQEESTNEFDAHLAEITNAIAHDTNCLGPDGVRHILLFVHGGLNDYSTSLARVTADAPQIATNGYYPLFINWDSGLLNSYVEHLWLVRQGEVHPIWGPLTSPLYLCADLGRAVTRAPVVFYYQITSDLTTVAKYERPHFTKEGRTNAAMAKFSEDERGLKLSIGGDVRKGGDKFWYGTSYIVTFPLKLLTAPIIDAMGTAAWGNMSRRTQTMFREQEEFSQPDNAHEIQVARERAGQPARGGVARLMAALDELTVTNAPGKYSITLIGHSMGTIVANEIVRTHPKLPYTNIVYMAAACSVDDFAHTVVPVLEYGATNAHFYNLTLHPICEAQEAQWFVGDITPRGSLLEWIDNFLAEPQTIPQRTLGQWNNIVSTTALIPADVARRTEIKAFSAGLTAEAEKDPRQHPQIHGDFSTARYWETSFWEPDKHAPMRKVVPDAGK